ncbi:MAG: ABC transporter ATP-binding protein [Deltaproteobacteria bacterium]|nr:ABC transporter ATP-binding protein [Deltaproteobacteria bacterium]MBW1736923.1 ABC transporter ATP-binding protein [Deltaproteobacteria bacterium]MBW1908902.1 ABC transporter ATP-binding protein [Deltaproteobacteria bacterium]MBW2032529.1 ABC transporter ATP-binding protein [Deltaproteobacteria bacterium]MBW2114159.1 ABC transporter ATP-binding protein [Deltaproteobacteria bacterium]
MTNDNFFSIHNLSISFGGLMAVDNVSFDVLPGSIFSIIGPNGAGKTTIFNCINGLYSPDSGKIIFQGKNIIGLKPHKIAQKGIARTFQNIELFSRMTTMENLMLGRHIHMKTGIWTGSTFYRRGSRAAQEEIKHRERVEEIIDLLDLQVARNQFVGGLPYGTQKLIELGRALALEPQLLLLDEPSAGMNSEEKQDLIFWIKDIQDELGVTILLIEHDMKLIMDISDRILAINFGKPITEGTPAEIQKHPEVLKAYLGEDEVIGHAA